MRLATVRTGSRTQAALIEGGTAQLLEYEDSGALLAALERGIELGSLARTGEVDAEGLAFAPPVLRPEKILCVGLNYHAHAAEANLAIPGHPLLFAKYWRSLLGAADDIVIPPETAKCDWEAELGLVIGRTVRRVSERDALDAVAGYTVVNDITMRDWQRHTSQFLPGKTFEDSTPIGPWLVSPDEVDHAVDLAVTCHVNGELMQSSSTSDMIFSAAQVIAYLSSIITLVPGDVIALGTPSGIGSARIPPRFLRDGDIVSTSVEGIGTITNRCVAERVEPGEISP